MRRWIRRMQLRVRSLMRGSAVDRELQRELQDHLQSAIDEGLASGLSEAEARYSARQAFGNLASIEEACRDTRRVSPLENVGRDVRYALRQLRRQPVFAVAAIAAVALGVGANAAIFGLANDLLLSSPTATRPDRLVHIRTNRGSHVSYAIWQRLDDSHVLSGVAGYNIEDRINWRSGDTAIRLMPLLVTPNYFDLLGIPPLLGRPFAADEARRTPDQVVVSYGFWHGRLGGDPDVIGRSLMLNGRPYAIVAVLPDALRSLPGYGIAPDVYLPLSRALMPDLNDPNAAAAMLIGRLHDGQSVAEGRAAVTGVLAGSPGIHGDDAGLREFEPAGGFSQMREFKEVAFFFGLLLALSGLVFLIACANVAGLLLARSAYRQREIALRLALGAGRRRLIQQLLTEGAVLAVIGTACGVLLALAAGQALARVSLPLPVPFELHVRFTGRLFVLAAALIAAGTLLSSLAPALRATRPSLADSLKTDQPPGLGGRLTFRRLLVAGQVAVSCVLVVVAVLFVRNLSRVATADPGFDTSHALAAQIAFVEGRQRADAGPAVAAMVERIRALPGVEYAAIARGLPLTPEGLSSVGTEIRIDGSHGPVRVDYEENVVGPDYFHAMGIALVTGREFTARDRPGSPAVVIVSRSSRGATCRTAPSAATSICPVRRDHRARRRPMPPRS